MTAHYISLFDTWPAKHTNTQSTQTDD